MLKELLSENSTLSSMRVMSFISLFIGGAIAVVGMYRGSDLSSLSILCGVFVGSAFAGKVAQKISEVKSETAS